MKVLVFGASGKVGRLVVQELLGRGHEVTAFVHTSELPNAERLTSVQGDIYDRPTVESAIKGHDTIISTLSSWGTKHKNVLSTAMETIAPAAESAGITRLVSLTGDGARAEGDEVTFTKHISHPLFNLIAAKVLRDSEDHIAILRRGNLNWVVLRSPIMTNGPSADYKLSSHSASLLIPRLAVAAALVDLAENLDWAQSAPFIRSR